MHIYILVARTEDIVRHAFEETMRWLTDNIEKKIHKEIS